MHATHSKRAASSMDEHADELRDHRAVGPAKLAGYASANLSFESHSSSRRGDEPQQHRWLFLLCCWRGYNRT